MTRNLQIPALVLILLVGGLQAVAQINVEGAQLQGSGEISFGYTGAYGNLGGASHGLGMGGQGTVSGFYYNPNFLSFNVVPYYDRSQANSDSQSITNSSGYTGSVNIFGGSHFPGTVSFNQTWDNSGTFGIPGTVGLVTNDKSRGFGIGWSEIVPGLPTLTAGFSQGTGESSLLGSTAQSNGTTRTLSLHSAYDLWGFRMNGGWTRLTLDSNNTGEQLTGEDSSASDTTNSFDFAATHKFPLRGSFSLGYTHSFYNSNFATESIPDGENSSRTLEAGTTNGSTNSANAFLNFYAGKLPVTVTASYQDNLYGEFQQQLINSGQVPIGQNFISPASHSVIVGASTGYTVFHVFLSGFVNRQEQMIAGQSYGVTQVGGNANYNFGKALKGLTVSIGAVDSANQEGNTHAGLVANANYNRHFGGWELNGYGGYNQDVQTLLAMYTTSSTNYGGSIRRDFRLLGERFRWTVGGGGGRSVFEQQSGSGSGGESVNTNLAWGGYVIGGSYSRSSGTSILTSTGLVPVALPVFPGSDIVVFSGTGRTLSFGASPVRQMTLALSYSKSNGDTLGPNVTSFNNTGVIIGQLRYRYRGISFNAGYTRLSQSLSAATSPPSLGTSYFFGISRWFNHLF